MTKETATKIIKIMFDGQTIRILQRPTNWQRVDFVLTIYGGVCNS
jgi:hypothetical protein